MAKVKTVFICSECGYETAKWMGLCPECRNFNTFEEALKTKEKASSTLVAASAKYSRPKKLEEISEIDDKKISTKINEFDRVLSGGFVQGSLTLVGGDPGIGKSTLLLQICESIGIQEKTILYISGEESIQQIKLRARRLNIATGNLLLLAETNLEIIQETIKDVQPDLVIIDSIQTIISENVTSSAGSITQTRESVGVFMKIAKGLNISIIIVGHVTKDGNIAGPKLLEHMVDTVIYFEGDKNPNYRLIRAVKNRFGNTNEIGIFEMREEGLVEIENPSEYMLSGRPIGVAGSTVTCSLEGTRPILTEVQALVSYTTFGNPRRSANGIDFNRAVMLIAVLEKRGGLDLGNYDTYVNIAGGMRINEPSLDLALVASIASSFKNEVIDEYTLIFGEVGLTGEVRAVTNAERRVQEAIKMGFKTCIMPRANIKNIDEKLCKKITVYGVRSVNEMLQMIF